MAPPRAGGAGAAAAAQAPSRPRGLLVVALLASIVVSASSSSPLLPRPLGLGFVPSPQQPQHQHQPPSSSSSSCCGGRHRALHTHARPAAAVTKRHALPPFDLSPLDPATLESMAAAASSAAASTGGALNEVTPEQLWVGFIAGVFPFVWAGYEFWKRIDTQQRCGVCQGSGLVYESATGRGLSTPRKCYACGGFLPWLGWKRFWLSNLDIGNGGVLQRPAPDYEALSESAKRRRAERGREGKE